MDIHCCFSRRQQKIYLEYILQVTMLHNWHSSRGEPDIYPTLPECKLQLIVELVSLLYEAHSGDQAQYSIAVIGLLTSMAWLKMKISMWYECLSCDSFETVRIYKGPFDTVSIRLQILNFLSLDKVLSKGD